MGFSFVQSLFHGLLPCPGFLAIDGLSPRCDAGPPRVHSHRAEGGLPLGLDGGGVRCARCREFRLPKAVPQMADTADVLSPSPTATEVLAIVANLRGAEDALSHGRPDILGFFSISETFQQQHRRGHRRWMAPSRRHSECSGTEGEGRGGYLSMGFGNPYGDPWHAAMVGEWCGRLHAELDIRTIALSDTVEQATPDVVDSVLGTIVDAFPEVPLGLTFMEGQNKHASDGGGMERRMSCLDGALGGHGGCPMAKDDLVGNLPTEVLMAAPQMGRGRGVEPGRVGTGPTDPEGAL